MISKNIVEPVQIERTASIVFVPQRFITVHFSVDYQKLNVVAKQDSNIIPRMDECITLLGEATILLKLDASSGYW